MKWNETRKEDERIRMRMINVDDNDKKRTQKVYIFGLQQCCKHPTTIGRASEREKVGYGGGEKAVEEEEDKKELLSIQFDSLLITTVNDLLRLNSYALTLSSSSAAFPSALPLLASPLSLVLLSDPVNCHRTEFFSF